jgi:hypothetical protein
MIQSKASKQDSAATRAAATETHNTNLAKLAGVQTKQAQAQATSLELRAAYDALAVRELNGSGVSAEAALKGSAEIAGNNELIALLRRAEALAQSAVDESDLALREAIFSDSMHQRRELQRKRAAALRALAQGGLDFGKLLDAAAAAGDDLTQAEHTAASAARLPSMVRTTSAFDTSRVGVRWLARALPQYIIQAIRETPIDHFNYFEEADREDKEATL